MRLAGTLLLLSCAGVVGSAANAQESEERVQLHGFGSWAYGNTDGNDYLAGSENARYNEASFALNVVASPTDRLRIVAQPDWRDDQDGTEVELDYGFAEWTFSQKSRMRAGK